ncbi:aminodeoxychorismate synthase component I [Nautilia lithotrophica]
MNIKNLKFFLIDFNGNTYIEDVKKLKDIYFSFPAYQNHNFKPQRKCKIKEKTPVTFERYKKAFNYVIEEIKRGNTYLLNLTFPTDIKTDCSLFEIFISSKAMFKLYYKNRFVCFSPERFVKIENDKIFTYPMKGTIDASLPKAKETILSNIKEMAEHTMVVDLLRNDLGIIGRDVKVNKFRFVDKIKAGEKELLQVSSEIEATLPNNWHYNWLELIKQMLPAGSITGTPKKKTIEIIKKAENYERGFYTGIFGITDEKTFLDSAVIIRYIETPNNIPLQHYNLSTYQLYNYIYKSGGGITIDSNINNEYDELIKKVYIPN